MLYINTITLILQGVFSVHSSVYNGGSMRFRYEVGIITFIQFILLSLLGIANGLNSIVSTCASDSHDCVSNLIVSLIFFIITAAWFAFIWILGYQVQERRSSGWAAMLIGAEAVVSLIALFNAMHHTDWLSLSTSIIDLVLALWVILLVLMLVWSGGSPIKRSAPRTAAGRPRRRRRPTSNQ